MVWEKELSRKNLEGMPRKWRQGAYDDDDDDYGDYDDDYDYEEHAEEQPTSTSLAAGGGFLNLLSLPS